MLSRYQKSGGFIQLLKLIETCGKAKQENFLRIIEEEDPRWSDTIKMKMLTIPKIFAWPEEQLAEIAGRLQPITIATAKHGIGEAEWEKFMKTFSHSQKRNIDDLADKEPTAAEISAAYVKIIEEVRSMATEGYLRLEKFAPDLAVEDDIEEKIGQSLGFAAPAADDSEDDGGVPNMDGFGGEAKAGDPAETKQLRMQVQRLAHENSKLKNENKVLKEKLGNIKKLAA